MLTLTRIALAFVFLTIAPAFVMAQSHATDRGSLLVGGSASFASTRTDIDAEVGRTTALLLQPSVQYFVLPGLSVGGKLSVAHFSRGNSRNAVYGVGPALSYYFGAGERPYYPFLAASLQYNRARFDNQTFTDIGYIGAAGAVFMLTSSVGLTGSVYYHTVSSRDTGMGANTIGAALGISSFLF